MSRTCQVVTVGKRRIELSNLEKILFPEDHAVKAELIEYYLKIAPAILSHIKGRPLSVVRYPDGIAGQRFFQKNRPKWAPEWIEYVTLGREEQVEYMMATEEASLVWLANLACIELHQMHCRRPHFDKPDYIVFDLDPPETYRFENVARIALSFREFLERFGYHAFVKTTGRKGLHILAPIEPRWGFEEAFEAASAIAKPFVEAHSGATTLRLKKEARGGKVLVDIYRNRSSQSIVAPYSVRGEPGAPVSMPVHWDRLASIRDPLVFHMRTVLDHLIQEGDAWEGMAAYAVDLHTQRNTTRQGSTSPAPSRTFQTPEALEAYSQKRDFARTPEPRPELAAGHGNAFVVHRHHASRLHYDLRLERDGTLQSWAVPKGLPPRPGIKRLAVAVEDHPLEYVNFEGSIPKKEYGGGQMWIFARGRYEVTKEKKNGFYFRLQSPELTAEYRMHRTKEKEWLLERVDRPLVDWLSDPVEPMLAESRTQPPASGDYLYEVKWDGIRAMISLDNGELRIRSRGQRDITGLFPELLIPDEAFRACVGLFDAEIVCLEEGGKPNFQWVVSRLQHATETGIERARVRHPAACYLFDCLYLDGRPIVQEPLLRRREWLADTVRKDTPYRISEAVEEGTELFEAARKMGLEGIMAKLRDSKYMPGKRSSSWLKIKSRRTDEYVIIGYTEGKGDWRALFGALHIGSYDGGTLKYRGKVGTGWDTEQQKRILSELKKIRHSERPIAERPVDDSRTTWLEPRLVCEVQYASLTKNGTLREPVFLRLRPDLSDD